MMQHRHTKRRHCQPTVAAWRGGVCEPQCIHTCLFLQSLWQLEVRSGEGSSCEQQLNNSGFVSVRVEEIRVFQACTCGWRCDTKCRALAHTRKCAFLLCLCFCLWSVRLQCRLVDRSGTSTVTSCFVPTTVLNASHSFFVLSQDRLVVCTWFGFGSLPIPYSLCFWLFFVV